MYEGEFVRMNQKTDHDKTNQGETFAEICPICDKLSNRYSIDDANLDFLALNRAKSTRSFRFPVSRGLVSPY